MPHRITRMRIDDAITTANNTTGAGAVAGVAGWATSTNWIGLLGVLVAVASALVSWYYQRKRFRLEAESKRAQQEHRLAESRRREEMHQAQLAAIRERCER